MRQVPHGEHFYTLLGSGRLASHLAFLFKQKNISFNQWSRDNQPETNSLCVKETPFTDERLEKTLETTTHILLALSDDSLPEVITSLPKDKGYQIIHFSGAFYSEEAIGLHPLMTFGPKLYDLNFYNQIPFVIDRNIPLKDVFPFLENPSYFIQPEHKALYHSYCTMAGNFTQILWQSLIKNFQSELNLPMEALFPFMLKNTANIRDNPKDALTGPLKRKDVGTIEKHMSTLAGKPEFFLYKSFVDYYIAGEQKRFSEKSIHNNNGSDL